MTPPAWRPMRPADVPGMVALAAHVHPTMPEDDTVLSERLALYPAGCFALDGPDRLHGYLLAHPWRLGQPPKLNTLLNALPDDPDTFYLHDLALHPARQGSGAATALLNQVMGTRDWPSHSLVAVNGSARFWQRFGFRHAPGPDVSAYGAQALHMVR